MKTRMTKKYIDALRRIHDTKTKEIEPKEVILDGDLITSMSLLHRHISQELSFPEYYGNNLDALYDILSTFSTPLNIKMINAEKLHKSLGRHYKRLLKVFIDASTVNNNVQFIEKT